MPNLSGLYPTASFQYLVTTDGTRLYNGLGSEITSLTVTSLTASYVTESYSSESYVNALDIEVTYLSASYSQFSTMSAVFGNISKLTSDSITASLYGTASWALASSLVYQIPYSSSITTFVTSSASTGSVYVDVVNKLLYIYSGTSWMSSSLA